MGVALGEGGGAHRAGDLADQLDVVGEQRVDLDELLLGELGAVVGVELEPGLMLLVEAAQVGLEFGLLAEQALVDDMQAVSGMQAALVAQPQHGAPQVLVNVFTARMAHEDNLINCGIYEGPISMAQAKAVDIRCDLIEPAAEEQAPTQPT